MPKQTGLILYEPTVSITLTSNAPVTLCWGDFVISTPPSVENTGTVLQAGETSINNIGQYFTFRRPK